MHASDCVYLKAVFIQLSQNRTVTVAEDVLLVLEQQAHSAVSQQPSTASSEVLSAPSTSSQHPSAASASPASSPGTVSDSSPPSQGAAPKSLHSDSTIIPLRGYKRAMVKSMVKAGAIPHFHLCDELDMRAIMSLRHRMKDDSVLQGVHLTFLPVMIKVHVSTALSYAFHACQAVYSCGMFVMQTSQLYIACSCLLLTWQGNPGQRYSVHFASISCITESGLWPDGHAAYHCET